MTKLLISETPLIVLPSLAKTIGLNEALVLQQVHFWIAQSMNEYDGHKWMYRTDDQWIEEFSFWSASTLRRTVSSLKKLGLIRVEKLARHFGGNSFDQKKYYTVIYSVVETLNLKPAHSASSQIDQLEDDNPSKPCVDASSQNEQMDKGELAETSDSASSQIDQMELSKMNTSSSQNDQFRSSQIDHIRSSQNDQLLTENKKEYFREGEEETAAPDENPLFSIDLKPASALINRERFSMHFEWEPSHAFFERCKMQGIRFDAFSQDEQESILGEFRSYWEATGTEENAGTWEHKFSQQLRRKLIDKAKVCSGDLSKRETRAAVTADVMDVGDTSW